MAHRPMSIRRRPIHQPVIDRNRPVIVFLTVCTQGRQPILARDDAVAVIVAAWRAADAWAVGRYAIMPDHIHCFCAPEAGAVPLRLWVRYWKALASRAWPRHQERPVWQRDFWDTQLRCANGYAVKSEYVWSNPVRHGLVATPEAWPYRGELTALPWGD